MMRRLIPTPVTSLAIALLWLALAQSPSLGNALLGLAAGLVLPLATRRFWPDPPPVRRWLPAFALIAVVLRDIVVANFDVARLVLGPVDRLRSEFVDVPLDLTSPFVATLLGAIISLTPGTLTTHIDIERGILRLHALDVADSAGLIAEIKARYEAPLKEIFGC